MSPRKRISNDDEAHQLPLRRKRRRTGDMEEDSDLEESLSHMDEPIAKRALRSRHKSDVPIRLNDHGSPELAESEPIRRSKQTHVVFGSESPQPAAIEEQSQAVAEDQEEGEEEDEEEEDSDDEAPETISHSHAKAETRAAQAEESRLLKQREQDERNRRRKRDAQLKAQVQSSEKRQNKAEREQEQQDEEQEGQKEQEERPGKQSKFDLEHLPTLLPEELLAIEAPARPPTPPTEQTPSAKKFMNALLGKHKDSETPDVIHQGKKIRVLQKKNKLLPPKAEIGPNNLRERWLQGRAAFQKVDKRGSNLAAYRRRPGLQSFV